MVSYNTREALAGRLKGQKLVIPDMRPIFAHWPGGQNKNYLAVKETIDKQLGTQPLDETAYKMITESDPAKLAGCWWPALPLRQYRVMVDLVIWFGVWDDVIEKLARDAGAGAERLRAETKALVRRSLCPEKGEGEGAGDSDAAAPVSSSPLMMGFASIAEEVRAGCDEEQRRTLLEHFDHYVDATRLEAEADQNTEIPSLRRYWEVRKLASGMGILLGFSEYALQVKLPPSLVNSASYQTLWEATIVINSIVNDLVSFKKEMRAGSVLSSVAILYHELNDLDAAVRTSLTALRELVAAFDRTAEAILGSLPPDSSDFASVSKVVELMRMVNTGNLEWSLQAKRYGVGEYMTEKGQIELVL